MLIDSAQIVFHRTPLENSGISPGLLREKSLLKEKFKEKEKRKFKEKGRPRPLATVKRHGRRLPRKTQGKETEETWSR